MRKLLLTAMLSSIAIFLFGQQNVYWRADGPANGNWQQGDNPCNEHGQSTAYPWWYNGWNPNEARGRPDCHDNGLGHRIHFNNDYQTNMDLNLSWYNAHQILFQNNAARTINGINGIDMRRAGAKIENQSSGTHTFNAPIAYQTLVELNPVSGNLVFNSLITNNGHWTDVWGGSDKSLTISGGLTGTGGLTVKNNTNVVITNNALYTGGTFVDAGTLELQGSIASSAVTVKSGAKLKINGSSVTVASLTIESGGLVEIEPGKALTVTGSLTNSAGNSGLVIKSNATSTGSLIHNTSSVAATAERYIAAATWATWNNGWHHISAPVASQSISSNWTPSGTNNDYDFYAWDEPTKTWLNQKVSGNNITTFMVGKGYIVAYEQTATKSFSGSLNVSNQSFSNLSHTPAMGGGWHLLGNPFASAVKWDDGNWALNNVAGTAKIWHRTNKSYSDITTNGIIPAGNGFFVQVSSSTNAITIPAAAREHSSTAFYKSGNEQRILLSVSPADGSSSQESQIIINPEATQGYDFYYDSRFLAGYAPQLYSTVQGEYLSTNSIPAITPETVIPLAFVKNEHSDFTLKLNESPEGLNIFLADLKTNATHPLSEVPEYNFSASSEDDPNRFMLMFGTVGVPETPSFSPLHVYVYNNMLNVVNPAVKAQIEVYNVQGQLVVNREIGTGLQSLPLRAAPGTYLVRMITEQATKTAKVVIQ